MPQNLLCDLCQSEPALLMQSNIVNGDAITVGESCMMIFLLTTVSSILDEMPAENAAQYAVALDPIVAKLALVVTAAEPDDDPPPGDTAPLADDDEIQAANVAESAAARDRRPGGPPAVTNRPA
jgi:hypothetical protein